MSTSTSRPFGPAVGRHPLVEHRCDMGDLAHGLFGALDGGAGRRSSGRRRSTPATKVVSWMVGDENGAASSAARTLGAVAGRKSELLFFSTLLSEGRVEARTTAATIHPAMISQRKRTVNRPRAANKRWSSRDRSESAPPARRRSVSGAPDGQNNSSGRSRSPNTGGCLGTSA